MIGKMLGHYQITEKLGEGGMGEVYKAFDTRLKRTVAIKRLRPELALDEDYRRRFLREAQLAASLTHQCIAGIYDILEENGDLLFVMEYVDGRTILDFRLGKCASNPFPSEHWCIQGIDSAVSPVVECGTKASAPAAPRSSERPTSCPPCQQ